MKIPILSILAALSVVAAARAQSTFNGAVNIQFNGGAPVGVTVTPAGGSPQAYAIAATQPSTQPTASAGAATQPVVPPGSPIPTAGGDVYLQPGGVYPLKGSVTINAANWRLHGNGATILSDSTGDTMFVLRADGDSIDHVHFDVPKGAAAPNVIEVDSSNDSVTNSSAGYVSDFVLVTTKASNTLIQNCTCPHLNQYCVFDDKAINVTVDHCHFGDSVALTGSDNQHLIRGGGTHVIVTNNVLFDPLKSDGSQQNVIDAQIGDWNITGNTIGKPGVESSGVWLGPLTTNDPANWPATGPTIFSNNTVNSTFVYLKAPSSNITISGNTFDRPNQIALYINANVSNMNIAHNKFINAGPWGSGIYVAKGATGITLDSNDFSAFSVNETTGFNSAAAPQQVQANGSSLVTVPVAAAGPGSAPAGDWFQAGCIVLEDPTCIADSSNNHFSLATDMNAIGWQTLGAWKPIAPADWQTAHATDTAAPPTPPSGN